MYYINMGGIIEAQRKPTMQVFLVPYKQDEKIVLLDECWRYKNDLTGWILGIKHACVVATLASGEVVVYDKVYKRTGGEIRRRVMDSSKAGLYNVHRRIIPDSDIS